MSENWQRLKAKREGAAMDGQLKAWTGQECKGCKPSWRKSKGLIRRDKVSYAPFPQQSARSHATPSGACPSRPRGMPNSCTAAASLTSRIITHVLVVEVLRRMSSVTFVHAFPSILCLSASCCHYVNPFPLPLGAWTSAWNR